MSRLPLTEEIFFYEKINSKTSPKRNKIIYLFKKKLIGGHPSTRKIFLFILKTNKDLNIQNKNIVISIFLLFNIKFLEYIYY